MRRRMLTSLLLLAALFPAAGRAAELNVFAAASLTDALKETSAECEKEGGDRVVLNLGASSTLARQIEEGAPADLFLSADEAKMNSLEKKKLLLAGTRKSMLSNTLSEGPVIAYLESPKAIAVFRKYGFLILGD